MGGNGEQCRGCLRDNTCSTFIPSFYFTLVLKRQRLGYRSLHVHTPLTATSSRFIRKTRSTTSRATSENYNLIKSGPKEISELTPKTIPNHINKSTIPNLSLEIPILFEIHPFYAQE